jgi:hypothetical protein
MFRALTRLIVYEQCQETKLETQISETAYTKAMRLNTCQGEFFERLALVGEL